MKVVIVGAGISGLTLAAMLEKANREDISIEIYERDACADYRSQGYALSLHQNQGLTALKELDIFQQLIEDESSQQISHVVFYDHNGKVILSTDGMANKEISYRVQRGLLKQVLIDKLSPKTIHYDSKVIDINWQGQVGNILLDNGKQCTADWIIACDGANSEIRKHLIKDKANYLGLSSINGVSRAKIDSNYLKGGYAMVLSDCGASLFLYPQPSGVYYSYTWYVKESEKFESFSQLQLLDFVKQRTKTWKNWMVELIEFSIEHTMGFRGYYDKDPINKFCFGNTWLIGDAAHPMSPFRGLEANLAMQDASQLAQYLLSQSHHCSADNKSQVEQTMVNVAKRAVKKSRRNAYRLHNNTIFSSFKRKVVFSIYRLIIKYATKST